MLLDAVIKTIKQENLLETANQSGKVLLNGLKEIELRYPGMVHSARGMGTICAIDAVTTEKYDIL